MGFTDQDIIDIYEQSIEIISFNEEVSGDINAYAWFILVGEKNHLLANRPKNAHRVRQSEQGAAQSNARMCDCVLWTDGDSRTDRQESCATSQRNHLRNTIRRAIQG